MDELFSDCFGIYLPDKGSERQRVIFKVTPQEAPYLDDLPLHWSQKRIGTAEDGRLIYRIDVHLNHRLLMEFLSRGRAIEVCEPLEFRQMIAEEITKTNILYE